MGLFDKVTKVTKTVVTETTKVVKDTSTDDVINVTKDIGTSTTRIVTDTGLDVADVATGFQYSKELDGAKKEMTDAGVLSAADAIEKNHYGFLKRMESEATRKHAEVVALYQQGTIAEDRRDQRAIVLTTMLNDVTLLWQLYEAAKQNLGQVAPIPQGQKWSDLVDIPEIATLDEISEYTTKWDAIGQQVFQAKLGIDVAGGAAAGVATLSAIAKSSKVMQVMKLSKVSKFLKIGKLVGKASTVLTIASIGLDVGLTVVQLEQRKAQLEEYLRELNAGIAEAKQDLAQLATESQMIEQTITQLLNSIKPAQTESSWETWVETKKAELSQLRHFSTSVAGLRAKALKIAQASRGESLELRVQLLLSVDSELSEDEAKQMIATVDQQVSV